MHAGATQVAASTLLNDKGLCEIDIATLVTAASLRVLAIVAVLFKIAIRSSGQRQIFEHVQPAETTKRRSASAARHKLH